MGTEIEAKFRVIDHAPIRARLLALGAACEGVTAEVNTFFDTPGRGLLKEDKGLRIRVNRRASGETLVVTYKGPKQAGAFKSREEIEVTVDDHDALVALFSKLGYEVTLSFEKKRETWQLGSAEIVLDTVPKLGDFFEIEAPDEMTIRDVLAKLALADAVAVKESYIQLVAEWVEKHSPGERVVKF